MTFGFRTLLDWIGNSDFAASDAHADRNLHQAHLAPQQIPDSQDPDSSNCFVDQGFAYVTESPAESWWGEEQGLHTYDSDGDGSDDAKADTIRAIPVTPEAHDLLTGSDAFRDHWQEVQAAYPDHDFGEPRPGLQFGYTAEGALIEGNGTFDYASPLADSTYDHMLADVAPDFDDRDYTPVSEANGHDLSEITAQSPEANVWPCSQGEFVGDHYGSAADGSEDYGGYDAGGYNDGAGHDDGGGAD